MSVSNPNSWAAGVAQRLKIIQSNWADEDVNVRREYLHEEISRSIGELSPSDRTNCLNALISHFPQGVSISPTLVASTEQGNPPATVKTACELLMGLLKDATEEEKKLVADSLKQHGLTIRSPGAKSAEDEEELFDIAPEMIRRLRLRPGSTINSSRVSRLMVHLLESVLGVDDLVWNLWKKIAPKSTVRRKGRADLRSLVGSFLTNDPSVSFADVTAAMDLSRRLNTSLFGALGPMGRNFAQKYSQKYSPEAITEAVELEGGGGFLKAKAVLCWQKFEELSADLDEQTITILLYEILANYAEELMLGPKAWQHTRNPFS